MTGDAQDRGCHIPYSDTQGKHTALDWYRKIQPKTVIDIGPGSGTYAHLMRPHHHATWTGIEAWAPYADTYRLADHYDHLVIADARHANPDLYTADLVIAGDILEHMPHHDAAALLTRIKRHATNLIVSIPVLHLDQDAVGGNPFERHIDHWTADQMRTELHRGLADEWVGDVLAYYWWHDPRR